jgi:hypothetical protein
MPHPGNRALTAAHTGCEESSIQISDKRTDYTANAWLWKASCHGKLYNCSSSNGVTKCTEQQPPVGASANDGATGIAATPSASSAGCTYDTQCKGDRICESGVCVSPKSE